MEEMELKFNHRQSTRYIHPTSPKSLLIRLRVYNPHADEILDCLIHYRTTKGWEASPMHLCANTHNSRYYQVEISIETPCVEYFFEIKTSEKSLYLGSNIPNHGTAEKEELQSFTFKWQPNKVFAAPSWVRSAVFYQIFPDRFYNGDPSNDPPQTVNWEEDPDPDNFFGGDLKGIEYKIPYLVDLGIDAVWLNPIFASISNHKYNTYDYMIVDPHFGDEKILKNLIDKLHEKGIKIILDGVFNHTGTDFWAFRDVLEKGCESRYRDWYFIYEFPVRINPPNYECWWDVSELPKLNVKNPEVKQYLLNVAAYWTREFEIDGWRLDVPNEIDHDFWIDFRKIIKNINPDCYIVGEIWDDGRPWLQGDQFDSVMNYLLRDIVLDLFARRKMGISDFDHHIGELILKYPQQVNYSLLNLLGSHDTARLLTLFKEEFPAVSSPVNPETVVRRMRPAIIFQLTYPGAPMIYYGDEVGITGGPDPGCRKTMIWDETRQNLQLRELYRTLISLRKTNSALTKGAYIPVLIDDFNKLYGFARQSQEQVCIIVLNLSSKNKDALLPLHELALPRKSILFKDGLSGRNFEVENNHILVSNIEQNYGCILIERE